MSQATLEQFKDYLSLQRRMSPHTVSNYLRDLALVMTFCKQRELAITQLKAAQIRQFVAQMHREGRSGRTIQRMLSALRALFRYLIKTGEVDSNPALAVQPPKSQKRLPSTLDVDQVNALMDHTPANTFISARDRAMMELFYSSGIRLSELAALSMRDVDFGDQLVYVTGKGNKQRVCPIGNVALNALKQWLHFREQAKQLLDDALFITERGRRLGARAIQQRLHHWGKQQGISDRVHPHRLRHAFASHMLESSGDLRAVQELLGHADIATTQIYTHVDFQHLASVYDQAHPRAKKTK